MDPSSSTVQNLGDFLLYLHDSKNLSAHTISNYRSSLSQVVLPSEGVSASHHPALTELLKSFMSEAVPRRVKVPEWDLTLVLERLRNSPFEPPKWDSSEDKLRCTLKTVFLLALASARRRGELQAISRDKTDLIFSDTGVSLRTLPGFLPKSAILGHDPQPFFVPALTPFSGRDSDDRKLCPVRMLKFYLIATGGPRDGAHLFVRLRGDGAVSSQTISNWIVRCIKMSFDCPIPAKAHEVRKVAVSWAYKGGAHSLEDILVAGSWATHTTFSSYYLADVRIQTDGRLRLAPIVAGRQWRHI